MKLETQDIILQEFKKVFRGYDPIEVKAFLEVIAEKYKQAVADQQKLQRALQELKQSYAGASEALQSAEQEIAKLRIEVQKIDRLVDARIDAELILQKARVDAEAITDEAEKKVLLLKEDIQYLENQKQRSAEILREYLINQLSILNLIVQTDNNNITATHPPVNSENIPESKIHTPVENQISANQQEKNYKKEDTGEHIGSYLDRTSFDELPEDINAAITESDEEASEKPVEKAPPVTDERRKKMVDELGQLSQQATAMFRKADFEKMLGESALKKSEEIINQIYSELEKKKSKELSLNDQSQTETP